MCQRCLADILHRQVGHKIREKKKGKGVEGGGGMCKGDLGQHGRCNEAQKHSTKGHSKKEQTLPPSTHIFSSLAQASKGVRRTAASCFTEVSINGILLAHSDASDSPLHRHYYWTLLTNRTVLVARLF